VCDLDGFKQINDRYGHLAGDKVLKRFAQLVRETCHEHDFLARMGGDEFVIVAPHLSSRAVHSRALALMDLAQQAGAEVCGSTTLSVSLGAAFFPADGMDAEKLLSEADKRMYSMKSLHHEDRDRTHLRNDAPREAVLLQ
jgi:diguanylate cyclase (GGDEF)-like protein